MVKLLAIPFANVMCAVLCLPWDLWFCVGGTGRMCCGLLSLGQQTDGVGTLLPESVGFMKQPQAAALGPLK